MQVIVAHFTVRGCKIRDDIRRGLSHCLMFQFVT